MKRNNQQYKTTRLIGGIAGLVGSGLCFAVGFTGDKYFLGLGLIALIAGIATILLLIKK